MKQLNKKRENHTKNRTPKSSKQQTKTAAPTEEPQPPTAITPRLGVALLVGACFFWAYLPVISDLVTKWSNIADYSHGFLVVPIAAYFLWTTKDSFPGFANNICWAGLGLILLAGLIRVGGSHYYLAALQGLSIPLWVSGSVLTLGGWKVFKWALPAIAFLIFMVPLPYFIETMVSLPLQKISTQLSLVGLQFFQQPAFAEGTTILLGENTLEIERACSGLRVFFGITALAYAFIYLNRRPLWTKICLVLAILPITLLANTFRIVLTGLLFQTGMGDIANHVSHDFAGIVMVLIAALLFWLTLLYLDRLFPTVESVDFGQLVRDNQ